MNASQYSWIYQLLVTFNKGNVDLFEKQLVEYKTMIENQVKKIKVFEFVQIYIKKGVFEKQQNSFVRKN